MVGIKLIKIMISATIILFICLFAVTAQIKISTTIIEVPPVTNIFLAVNTLALTAGFLDVLRDVVNTDQQDGEMI